MISSFNPQDLVPLAPALALSVGAIVLLLSEVFLSASGTRGYQALLAVMFAGGAGFIAARNSNDSPREVFGGFGVHDPFGSVVTTLVCAALVLAVLLAAGFLRHRNAERGEFYALMLFATAGMSLLALSAELITLFVSLEVLSIATYALAAYLRRGPRPAEAGFKYFILGAFSSAVLLYGAALLYGATGTTHIGLMAAPLRDAVASKPLLVYSALLLLSAGFAFKVSAVPFHIWTPDVYEGAPTPVTALMSSGVKAAAFASMVRVFLALAPALPFEPVLALFASLAAVTMVVGNVLAIPQRNVKRMLAYSSIAHAGYILVAVAALFAKPASDATFRFLGAVSMGGTPTPADVLRSDALQGILFYLAAYMVTTIGAFGTLSAIERREDEDKGFAWDLERFAGLAERRPGWAAAMAVFMLSLGGIPPTFGFLGKLYVFRSAVDAGLVGLAIIGVLSSVVGAYYYLRVVVYMYMRPSPTGVQVPGRQWSTEVALAVSAFAVVAMGVLPGPLSNWLERAGTLFGGR
ncbi:MAG: NADH-quinone oxidoreductase subunit N [Myxococcaceae bacterium]